VSTKVKPRPAAAAGARASALENAKRAVAIDVFQGLGVRTPTTAQLQKLIAWFNQEGGNWNNSARYNPLNTTLALPGAGNTGSQGNIKVYTSWQQGIDATVKTLKLGAYSGVVNALKNGSASQFEAAVNSSPWGTKFPGGGSTVAGTKASINEPGAVPQSGLFGIVEGKTPGFSNQGGTEKTLEQGAEALAKGFSWAGLAKFALNSILLVVGAALVIYGIIVGVRNTPLAPPRLPVPVPV
jgi:hypothetical protein